MVSLDTTEPDDRINAAFDATIRRLANRGAIRPPSAPWLPALEEMP